MPHKCDGLNYNFQKPVDAIEFLDGTRKYFPEATLSFGWTKNNISELTIHQKRSYLH